MKYEKNSIVFTDWKIVEEIGEGSYGKVFEICKTDYGITTRSALKVIRIPRSTSDIRAALSEGMNEESVTSYFQGFVEEIVQEIAVMSSLESHPNIVSYKDHCVLNHNGEIGWDILIRMELLTPLLDYIVSNPLNEADVVHMARGLCSALMLCQKKGLIHRDIKPENIFVSETGQFKLGDFGVARTIEKTTGGLSKKGTESYMAPEVYLNKPYGSSVDIYSLGLVLYKLMNNNRLPFLPPLPQPITFADRENALSRRMKGETLPPPVNACKEFSDIILKACAYNPEDRYRTAADMMADIREVKPHNHQTAAVIPNTPEISSFSEETKGIFDAASSEETIGLWNISTPENETNIKQTNPACDESAPQNENTDIEFQRDDTLPEESSSDLETSVDSELPVDSEPSDDLKTSADSELSNDLESPSDLETSVNAKSPADLPKPEKSTSKKKWLIGVAVILIIGGCIGGLKLNEHMKAVRHEQQVQESLFEAAEAQINYAKKIKEGDDLKLAENYEEAIEKYQEALQIDATQEQVYSDIVQCYLIQNQIKEAQDFLKSDSVKNLPEKSMSKLNCACHMQHIYNLLSQENYMAIREYMITNQDNLLYGFYQKGYFSADFNDLDLTSPMLKLNSFSNSTAIYIYCGTFSSEAERNGNGKALYFSLSTAEEYYCADGEWSGTTLSSGSAFKQELITTFDGTDWLLTFSGNIENDMFHGDINLTWQKLDGSQYDSTTIHAEHGTLDCLSEEPHKYVYARGNNSGMSWSKSSKNGLKGHSYKIR